MGSIMRMFMVGGAVRDWLMDPATVPHDLDFSVVAESFSEMRTWLNAMDITIFIEKEEFGTIRGRFPKNAENFGAFKVAGKAADFVWARVDGPYSDGRRPDWTRPGTLHDDLARRDFTVNAMAMNDQGDLIDPFDGATDLKMGVLACVGNANDRIQEDALRILRAIRFSITKDFWIEGELSDAIIKHRNALSTVSKERIREELEKMFEFDTFSALTALHNFNLEWIVFSQLGLSLKPMSK